MNLDVRIEQLPNGKWIVRHENSEDNKGWFQSQELSTREEAEKVADRIRAGNQNVTNTQFGEGLNTLDNSRFKDTPQDLKYEASQE